MQVYSFYGNVPRRIHEDNGDSHRKCICRTDDKIDVREVTHTYAHIPGSRSPLKPSFISSDAPTNPSRMSWKPNAFVKIGKHTVKKRKGYRIGMGRRIPLLCPEGTSLFLSFTMWDAESLCLDNRYLVLR